MTNWTDVEAAAPDLASRVRARFDAHLHHTLATLRADGSPRIAGTEVPFQAGEVWLGSMPGARKALDLQRDPRMALHSCTADETMAGGDARISGRAIEVTDADEVAVWLAGRPQPGPPGPFHLFRVDIGEVVLTRVEGDRLHVAWWTPAGGLRHVDRA